MQSKIMRGHFFNSIGRGKKKDKIPGVSLGKGEKVPLKHYWEEYKTGSKFQGNQIICNKSIKNMHIT